MGKSYGLSALFEAMNHIDKEEKNLDEIADVATGSLETVTFMDAVDAGLINDIDESATDDEMEDVLDEVDPDDPEINRMLDKIDPTDEDEEVDLEGLDMALEAFIEAIEEGKTEDSKPKDDEEDIVEEE